MPILPNDWAQILWPRQPLLEHIVRVSVIYLVLYFIFRTILRREAGRIGVSDMLVVVLLASTVRLGIIGRVYTVGDALIAAAVLIFWDWLLNYLAYHSALFRRLLRARPKLIVADGRILYENLQRELLTRQQLKEQLRLHGVESLEEVEEAYLEPDGQISVIKVEEV